MLPPESNLPPPGQEISIQSNAITGVVTCQGLVGAKSDRIHLRSLDGLVAFDLLRKDFPYVSPGEQVLISVTVTRVGPPIPPETPKGILLPGLGKGN